ncbi:hypothetical protein [Candidatus Palauibacter sp.]|uniref:hypothetical protein n=1 Tax=Candidatus Palauibacter sp. TaxID=3101350 RepID=UPI003B02DA78
MRTHVAVYSLFCVLNCAVAACRPDAVPESGPSVRDSAGVRIVEYGATPARAGPFVFSPQPLYRYGTGPEDYPFRSISRGALLADGSAAVIDALNAELVLIAPDGTFRGLLAGRGDGPGELDRPTAVFSLGGDTLLVDDHGHARLTFFGGGTVAREVDTRLLNRSLRVLGIGANGRLLMASGSYMPGFAEPWLRGHMVRFDPDAGVADTVGAYDWVRSSPREGPFNPFETGGDVTAAGGRFVYVRSDRPEVTWRNPDGTVHQIVRWRSSPAYPDEEHWRRFESSRRIRLRPANPHIQSEAEFEELVQTSLARYELAEDEPLPLISRPFGDREGRVWLGHYTVGWQVGGVSGYSILAPDGTWLGDVRTPRGVRLLDVAQGRALGVSRDEMGVESLVLYELLPAGTTEGT